MCPSHIITLKGIANSVTDSDLTNENVIHERLRTVSYDSQNRFGYTCQSKLTVALNQQLYFMSPCPKSSCLIFGTNTKALNAYNKNSTHYCTFVVKIFK